MSRRPVPLLLTLGALALAAALAAAWTSGALDPRLLLDPGPLVRWGGLAVQVTRDAALALTLGGLGLLAMVLPPPASALPVRTPAPTATVASAVPAGDVAPRLQLTHRAPHARAVRPGAAGDGRAWLRVRRLTVAAALVWVPAQVLDVLATHLSVTGSSPGDPTYGAQLWQFLTQIELGRNLGLAVLLAALAVAFVVAVGGLTSAGWALGVVAIALVPLALTGHAAGAVSHDLAVSGMYLHYLGLGLWAGGVALLAAAAPVLGRDLPSAARRFSVVAGWSVVLVLVSGLASAAIRLTSPAELLTHPYGRLLTVKIFATLALMAAGWWHRTRLLAGLDGEGTAGADPRRAFRRLLSGEALTMAAVVGVGAALASSPPPVPQEAPADPSPVFAITGYPEPPFPSVEAFLTQWQVDPLVMLACVAGTVLYLRWARRLRARGDGWSAPRTAAWVAAMIGLAYTTQGGPTVYGRVLFSVHMTEHMLLAMVLPILMVLGAPVTLALRALPVRTDGSRGGREWLLALVSSRWAQFWAHPVVAAMNFSGSLFVFYYTSLFPLAMTTHPGHLAMIAHFTLAGYLFANALVGIDPHPGRPPFLLRFVLLLATMAAHAFFGVSLMSLSGLLAPEYYGWLGLSWGVDALADQEAGGNITWGIGELPTLAMALGVGYLWTKDDAREARRYDRRAERDEDAELEAYNDMLARRAGETHTTRESTDPRAGAPDFEAH